MRRGAWKAKLDSVQGVLVAAETDFDAVGDGGIPVGVGVRGVQAIAVVRAVRRVDRTAGQHRLAVDRLGAGKIQRHRVKRGEHPHIRHDGHIIFGVAVTVGRDVAHDGDMERRSAVHHRLGVLGDLVVEAVKRGVERRLDGVLRADGDAASAADAFGVVNGTPAVCDLRRVVGADTGARAAADAGILIDVGLAVGVLLHFARARAAAHAEVLERAAEACLLMPLEVRERDDNVGVHERTTDPGGLAVFAARDRHLHIVRALQTVGDDDVTAGGERRKAVGIGGVHMLQRIFAAADVERVAVGEERQPAPRAHEIGDGLGVVRAQVCKIAQLAKVELDGDKFAFKINAVQPSRDAQPLELFLLIQTDPAAKIGKIDVRNGHTLPPALL